MTSFQHIHEVLTNNGYPESNTGRWRIQIEERRDGKIIPHWYDCTTRARAKAAVRSLLNHTDLFEVVVYSPICNPITFSGRYTELSEREWKYYFGTGPQALWNVKFYWPHKEQVWQVRGSSVEDVTAKCHDLCEQYHAVHFEVQ